MNIHDEVARAHAKLDTIIGFETSRRADFAETLDRTNRAYHLAKAALLRIVQAGTPSYSATAVQLADEALKQITDIMRA